MFSFPLYIFLFIYFAALVVIGAFFAVNILHLTRTGTLTFASFAMTLFILALVLVTLLGTRFLLQDVDWREMITILDNSEDGVFTTGDGDL